MPVKLACRTSVGDIRTRNSLIASGEIRRPLPAAPGWPPDEFRLKRSFWLAPSMLKELYRLYCPPALGPPDDGMTTCGVSFTRSVKLRPSIGILLMMESATDVPTPWCEGLKVLVLPVDVTWTEVSVTARDVRRTSTRVVVDNETVTSLISF